MQSRTKLLKILSEMPDEAFGYFVIWATGNDVRYPDTKQLGGFMPESRKSIIALKKAAIAYANQMK